MRREMLPMICCPGCKARLELKAEAESGAEVLSGNLKCVKCGHSFPIIDGIPELLPESLRDVSRK